MGQFLKHHLLRNIKNGHPKGCRFQKRRAPGNDEDPRKTSSKPWIWDKYDRNTWNWHFVKCDKYLLKKHKTFFLKPINQKPETTNQKPETKNRETFCIFKWGIPITPQHIDSHHVWLSPYRTQKLFRILWLRCNLLEPFKMTIWTVID